MADRPDLPGYTWVSSPSRVCNHLVWAGALSGPMSVSVLLSVGVGCGKGPGRTPGRRRPRTWSPRTDGKGTCRRCSEWAVRMVEAGHG